MKTLEELAEHGELMYAWETELVKQQLYDVIKDAAYAARVGRQLVEVVQLKAGAALDFVLETVDSLVMRRITEGATIPVDVESYSKVTVTPVKYGNQVIISQEIREDANWDIMRRNLRRCGTQVGLKEDAIIFAAFADGTYGFGTENAVTSAGTELDIVDILSGIKEIKQEKYYPNVMVIHPTQESELNQIDTFVEADKLGSRITFERGFCGRIFGLDVVVTPTLSASTAYILDTREAGVLVIRRPLTMRAYEIPERDSVATAVTFREEARVLRAKAGATVTVS